MPTTRQMKRLSVFVLAAASLSALPQVAHSSTLIFIDNVRVTKIGYCPSGYGSEQPGGPQCLKATKVVDLKLHAGELLKVAYKLNLVRIPGTPRSQGKSHEIEIVALNPPQEVGTNYTKSSFLDKAMGAALILSEAYDANHGIPPPDTSTPDTTQAAVQPAESPSPQMSTSVQSDGTSQYTAGVNHCVSVSYDLKGVSIFHNVCSSRINVWWASATGHGSLTLGPGDEGTGAGSNMSGGAKGVYEYYVCSEHYLAVDASGHPIVSMVADFKCVNRGY